MMCVCMCMCMCVHTYVRTSCMCMQFSPSKTSIGYTHKVIATLGKLSMTVLPINNEHDFIVGHA